MQNKMRFEDPYRSRHDIGTVVAFLMTFAVFVGIIVVVMNGTSWLFGDDEQAASISTVPGITTDAATNTTSGEQASAEAGDSAGTQAQESEIPVAVLAPPPVEPVTEPAATPTPEVATGHFLIGNTNGSRVHLRRVPALSDSIALWPAGTRMDDLGEEATGSGMTWRKVRDPNGEVGYVASQFLVPQGELAAPAAPAPAPSPAAEPTPAPEPTVSGQFRVANTGGDGVYIRRSPNVSDRIVAWPDNTIMDDLGEQVTGDGMTWHKVRDPRGTIGYIPSQWLTRVDG
jgi:hypothetical protein